MGAETYVRYFLTCDNCMKRYIDGASYAVFDNELTMLRRAIEDGWTQPTETLVACPKCSAKKKG